MGIGVQVQTGWVVVNQGPGLIHVVVSGGWSSVVYLSEWSTLFVVLFMLNVIFQDAVWIWWSEQAFSHSLSHQHVSHVPSKGKGVELWSGMFCGWLVQFAFFTSWSSGRLLRAGCPFWTLFFAAARVYYYARIESEFKIKDTETASVYPSVTVIFGNRLICMTASWPLRFTAQ